MASTIDILVKTTEQGAQAASDALGGLAGIAGGALVGALAAATAAFAAFSTATGIAIADASAVENSQARLVAALNATHDASGLTQQAADALAMQFRDLYGGSAEAVTGIETLGIRSGQISAQQMPQFIKAVADLGAVMGNTTTAAQVLARAQDDPVGAFTRLERVTGVYDIALKNNIATMVKHGDTAGATAAILNYVSQVTGGTAAAAADTLSGKWSILTGHFTDFMAVLGGPVIAAIENLLDVANPTLDGVYSKFENTFLPLITDMAAWGQALVEVFAQGMQSAFGLVVDVINQLGSIIADLMAPGSPPKFLPLLDVWGRKAVDVYLAGWTTFDKSVFDEIGTAIKAGLDSSTIQTYADTMHQLADANDAVAAAQLNLNNITSAFDAQLSPLQQKLAEVTNQQQQAADAAKIAALQQDMANPGTSVKQKASDALEIQRLQLTDQIANINLEKNSAVNAAKEKLTAAQALQKNLQDQAAAQKNLIDIQAEQNKQISQGATAVGALGSAIKGLGNAIDQFGGAAGGGLTGKIDAAMEGMKTSIAAKADDIKKAIDAKFEEIKADVIAFFAPSAMFKPVTDALAAVQALFATHLPQIRTNWNTTWALVKTDFEIISPVIQADVKQMVDIINTTLMTLVTLWDQHFSELSAIQHVFTVTTITLVSMLFVDLVASVTVGLTLIETLFRLAWDIITLNFAQFGKDFENAFNSIMAVSVMTAVANLSLLAAAFGYTFDEIVAMVVSAVDKIMSDVNNLIDSIKQAIAWAEKFAHIQGPSSGGSVPKFATGADFIVPPGFGNDTFPMLVSSGERVRVTPAGASSIVNNYHSNSYNVAAQYGGSPSPSAITRELWLMSKLRA